MKRTHRKKNRKALFEAFETRTLLSAVSTPSGLTPIEVRGAYGFSQITFTDSSGQSVAGDGAGQTIAIVDPYNAKTIDSDLDTFDQAFNFDSTGQNLYQEFGAANSFLSVDSLGKGESNSGWALEVALDVEWAHAIAPAAKIDLVEAANASTTALLAAVKTAADLPGVSVVSMSWGGSEARNETTFDSTFTTPNGHQGVTFVAASGDDGATAEWPAVSPNVLSVGGTTLNVSSSGTYISESAWSDGGGGYSSVESEPAYQDSVNTTGLRSTPDVAYDANPNSGFSVYTSVKQGKQSGWFTVGGTSAGAPQWAALVAIADQGRTNAGETTLDGPTQTLPYLYEMSSSSFHNITAGSNGYRAAAGYDLATGLGSPIASAVVSELISPAAGDSSGSGTTAGDGSRNTGSGFGFGGATRGFPPRFHMPPSRFPNRFHAWDVPAANQTIPLTVKPQHATALAHQSIAASEANGSGQNSACGPGIATADTGVLGSTDIAATGITSTNAVTHAVTAGISPMSFTVPTTISIASNLDSQASPITHAFSTAAPITADESMENIFSPRSAAANVAAMFSNTAVALSKNGLKASLLVLPLIAFWAYQSRLSKSRAIQSIHFTAMEA